MPINVDTLNRLYGMNLNCLQMEEFLKSVAEPRKKIVTSEDVVIGRVGRDLYEKFFRNYTRSNGTLIRRNWMLRLLRACQFAPAVTIATSRTAIRLCRSTAMRACLKISWIIRISGSC